MKTRCAARAENTTNGIAKKETNRIDPASISQHRALPDELESYSSTAAKKQRPRKNPPLCGGGSQRMTSQPGATGHFGPYGGRFVPKVLMAPLEELDRAYRETSADPKFQAELAD